MVEYVKKSTGLNLNEEEEEEEEETLFDPKCTMYHISDTKLTLSNKHTRTCIDTCV